MIGNWLFLSTVVEIYGIIYLFIYFFNVIQTIKTIWRRIGKGLRRRNLKVLAHISCVLLMVSLPGDQENWWLHLSYFTQELRGIISALLMCRCRNSLNGFFLICKGNGKIELYQAFPWGCLLQVLPQWSVAYWALVYEELVQDLKYASGMKRQKAYENEYREWKDRGMGRKTHGH